MTSRPLVSARRNLRCNHRRLDFCKGRYRLAQRDRRSFPDLDTCAISPWRSRTLIFDAALLVRPRFARGWSYLRGNRCEQSRFFALLSELRLDEGAHDRDWRIPFPFHSAHEGRNLRLTRRADCRVGYRGLGRGTRRRGCNLNNPAMARYVQRDMVSPACYSAYVRKWPFAIVAERRILLFSRFLKPTWKRTLALAWT